MRTHRTLLLSLALNLALAVVWLFLHGRSTELAAVIETTQTTTPSNEAVVVPAPQVEVVASNPPVIPFLWPMLEADDPRAFVTNLRAVDCPEHVVRELLVTKLDRHYRPKFNAEPVAYDPWVGRDRRDADRMGERNRTAALRREQSTVIRELLGYDWNSEVSRDWNREAAAGVFLGFLTDVKAQQVMAQVLRSVQSLEDQFSFFESRIVIDDDIERMTRLRADIASELGKFLSPQELDELETRAQLGLLFTRDVYVDGMDATGAELRAILHASRGYRDFFTSILLERGLRGEDWDRGTKRKDFEAAVLSSLGPARFAEFQRAQEKDFRDTFKFIKDHDLPKATAVTLYEAQRKAEAQRREITNDPDFTAEERKVALEVLQTATAASVANVLGKQFTNYFNGNGGWIKQLSSATTVKPVPREVRR